MVSFVTAVFRLQLEQIAFEQQMRRRNVRALFRLSAAIRQFARRSIRRTQTAVSAAGEPPRTHGRGFFQSLRDSIVFDVDENKLNAVIGAVKFPRTEAQNSRIRSNSGTDTVPHLMEFGGTVRAGDQFFRHARTGRRTRIGGILFLGQGRRRQPRQPGSRSGGARKATRWRFVPAGTVMRYEERPYMEPARRAIRNRPTLQRAWQAIGVI